MDDLIAEFLAETNESIAELDNDIVKLEQNPNDKDLLSGIFRLMHTIKGTCGFLGLGRLEKVAHKAEDVLGRFRDGELDVKPEYITLILESLDVIKTIIKGIEDTGEEPEGDDSKLIEKLEAVYEGKQIPQDEEKQSDVASDDQEQVPQEKADAQEKDEPTNDKLDQAEDDKLNEVAKKDTAGDSQLATQTLRVNVDVLEDLMTMVSELVLTRNQLMQIMRTQRESEFSGPLQNLNQVVSELQDGVMKTRMQPIGNAWSKLPRIIRDISMELNKKIDLEMKGQDTELDRQVLEMIKDPLTHMVRNSGDHGIETPQERVAAGKPETGHIKLNAYHEGGHIIIQIKDDGRGLAIDKIKQKVLDNGLATQDELDQMSGHQIQQFIFKAGFSTAEKVTAVSGRGVGMDVVRSNIENIGGSIELNSVEGKGTTFFIKIPLTLAIVSALIVECAKERFAIPQLAVRELVMATENGKSRIEMIKGTPVFRLRDHLLPLVSLRELLKMRDIIPQLDDLKQQEEGAEKFVKQTDKQTASIQQLKQDDGISHSDEWDNDHHNDHAQNSQSSDDIDQDDAPQDDAVKDNVIDLTSKIKASKHSQSEYIVVTQVGSYQFGIIVDQVYDTEEIVVKPVSKILRDIDLFSGNTILGDGSVIMILDPAGIAKTTGDIEGAEGATDNDDDQNLIDQDGNKKTSLLLFKAGDETPKAVPLALVARLENIKLEEVEYGDNQMLVQYRGRLMPLVPMTDDMNVETVKEKPVLVFSSEEHSMGLIVDEILDILEDYIDVQYTSGQAGVLGSAIINEKATDIIDVSHYVMSDQQEWFNPNVSGESYQDSQTAYEKRRILLIDDSPFFRNMIAPLLNVAGYNVTTLESAVDALALLEKGEVFDVIVSDIEMPDMSGFEFAEKVRQHSELKHVPLVALSSHATSDDMSRGEKAGFQKYVAKFDKDTLISTINETVGTSVDDDDQDTNVG